MFYPLIAELDPTQLGTGGGIVAAVVIAWQIIKSKSSNGTKQVLATLATKLENMEDQIKDMDKQLRVFVAKMESQRNDWGERIARLEERVEQLRKPEK